MEENELQELPVYLHQLSPEELNSKLLDLIGSRGLLEFIKNKNNENQLTKILDESALKDKMTAKRMLSIGYIVLTQSPRALNRMEGIIQKIYKVLDQVSFWIELDES